MKYQPNQPTPASPPLPPSVCLEVEPIRADILGETFGLGWAGQGFDFERAEEICKTRKVLQVTFRSSLDRSLKVEVDFQSANGFADFVFMCEDELMRDSPAFDSEAEEHLSKLAVKLLVKELHRLEALKGEAK